MSRTYPTKRSLREAYLRASQTPDKRVGFLVSLPVKNHVVRQLVFEIWRLQWPQYDQMAKTLMMALDAVGYSPGNGNEITSPLIGQFVAQIRTGEFESTAAAHALQYAGARLMSPVVYAISYCGGDDYYPRHAWYLSTATAYCAFGEFRHEWRTTTAVALARGMYRSFNFSAMPILADAIEDAGCDVAELLEDMRNPEAHFCRGCWVVDELLGVSAQAEKRDERIEELRQKALRESLDATAVKDIQGFTRRMQQ